MRRVLLIGIGVGNPDHLTVQAIKALNAADVFFIPSKGAEKAALRDLRRQIIERFVDNRTHRVVEFDLPKRVSGFEDYAANVADWHQAIEQRYVDFLERELAEDETGALLIWGDPTLYDSALRILDAIRSKGAALQYEIIPGVTSVQVLAARHRIALNKIGEPFLVTTGRRLAEGLPASPDTVVVLLDGEQTFTRLVDQDLDIFWGAYLGTEDEILIAGPVAQVAGAIETARAEARSRKGWIMDTYLLRRRGRSSE